MCRLSTKSRLKREVLGPLKLQGTLGTNSFGLRVPTKLSGWSFSGRGSTNFGDVHGFCCRRGPSHIPLEVIASLPKRMADVN